MSSNVSKYTFGRGPWEDYDQPAHLGIPISFAEGALDRKESEVSLGTQ